MKIKRLMFSLLLSAMLIVTFIPTIAFGNEDGDYPDEVTIDQCGSVAIEAEGWTKSDDDPSVWYNADTDATVTFSNLTGDGSYDFGDGYTHFMIGDTVAIRTDNDHVLKDVKVNGNDSYSEEWGEYAFPVQEDIVDAGSDRQPGNVITLSCEKRFQDLTEEEKDSADEIRAGEEKTVSTAKDSTATFKFVAPASGKYVFYSAAEEGAVDPHGRVLDSDGAIVAEGWDEHWNFKIYFDAEEGQTYYLQGCDFWGNKVTYSVVLAENDIENISFAPNKPYQLREILDTRSELTYNDEGEEMEVQVWAVDKLVFKEGDMLSVTKKDGTTQTYAYNKEEGQFLNEKNGDPLPEYPDIRYDGSPTTIDCPVGSQGEVIITYAGHSTTEPVAFVENPYTGLTITPSEGIKAERYETDDSNIQFLCTWEGVTFNFTKQDGGTVVYHYDNDKQMLVSAEDELELNYSIGYSFDPETYEDITWEVGSSYDADVSAGGIAQNVKFTVIEHVHDWQTQIDPAVIMDDESWDGYFMKECKKCHQGGGDGTIYAPKGFKVAKAVYNGKLLKPAITVTDRNGKVIKSSNYTVKYSNNKNAGKKAKATVTFKGNYSGTKHLTFTIYKANQKMTVKAATKKLKVKKLKKKAQTIKVFTVKKQGGRLTFKKVSGSAKLKVNAKTGKVTVKKKTKKGTYKMKVKVTSAASANYKAASKTVTVVVKVKK